MRAPQTEVRQVGRIVRDLTREPLSAEETALVQRELSALADEAACVAARCDLCHTSADERKLKSCHVCNLVRYCGRECQGVGWPAHKLACKVLAADREILSAALALDSAPLLPLDGIFAGLRSRGHAGAYEAAAHLSFLLRRCDLAPKGEGDAASDEAAAPRFVRLLASPGLAAGGLRTYRAAAVLRSLLDRPSGPQTAATIVAAGALPLLVSAVSLPSQHMDLGSIWSLRAAADAATELLGALARQTGLGPSIIDAGAVPALAAHLKLLRRPGAVSPTAAASSALRSLRFTAAVGHVRRSAAPVLSVLKSAAPTGRRRVAPAVGRDPQHPQLGLRPVHEGPGAALHRRRLHHA